MVARWIRRGVLALCLVAVCILIGFFSSLPFLPAASRWDWIHYLVLGALTLLAAFGGLRSWRR